MNKGANSTNSNRDAADEPLDVANDNCYRYREFSSSRGVEERPFERGRKAREKQMITPHAMSYVHTIDESTYYTALLNLIKAVSDARIKMALASEMHVESSSRWAHRSLHTVDPTTGLSFGDPRLDERVGEGLHSVSAASSTATVSARYIPLTTPWKHAPPIDPTYIAKPHQSYGRTLWSSFRRTSSILLISSFIPGAVAQGHDPATDLDWRQRAMASLTDAIAQYAFLVPPLIVLGIGGLLAGTLTRKKAQYALAGFGLLMTILYGAIHVDPIEGATGSDQSVRTAVGILYLLFMCGYCRSVILMHGKDKGTVAVATLLGLAIGCGCLTVGHLRDFVASSGHSPAYIIPLVLPSGFFICDVVLHLHDADRMRKGRGAEPAAHHERFGTHIWTGPNGAASEDLRFRLGFPNLPRQDISEEEHRMGDNSGGNASQTLMSTLQDPTPTSGNWIIRLFSKSKSS